MFAYIWLAVARPLIQPHERIPFLHLIVLVHGAADHVAGKRVRSWRSQQDRGADLPIRPHAATARSFQPWVLSLCVSVGWAAASTKNSLDGNWSFGLVLTLVRNGLDTMGIEGKQVQFGLDYSHTWAGLDWFGPKLFGLRLLEIVDRRVVWHQFNLSGNTGKVSAFSKEMGTCDWSFPTSPAASDWPPSPPLTHPL
jgi:hypothetical protein